MSSRGRFTGRGRQAERSAGAAPVPPRLAAPQGRAARGGGRIRSDAGRRGLTLLEVLVATVITAMVASAALGWHLRQTAVTAAVTQECEGVAAVRAVWRLLQDDLRAAVVVADDRLVVRADGLEVRTLHAPPGDPPGALEVRWRWDAERRRLLRRRDGGRERVVSTTLRDARFARTATGLELVLDDGRSTSILPIALPPSPERP